MSSRRETSPVLITAQSNKPVLHNSSNIAIFTWEAELVMYSCAAFPHVSLTPAEQGMLHQGHNGWFDLKRSNYPQQWSDLIVYWQRRGSVIEVKLEVIVSGRCGERWNCLIGCGVRLSENKGWLIHGYQWLGRGPKGGLVNASWYQKLLATLFFLTSSVFSEVVVGWIKANDSMKVYRSNKQIKHDLWRWCFHKHVNLMMENEYTLGIQLYVQLKSCYGASNYYTNRQSNKNR